MSQVKQSPTEVSTDDRDSDMYSEEEPETPSPQRNQTALKDPKADRGARRRRNAPQEQSNQDLVPARGGMRDRSLQPRQPMGNLTMAEGHEPEKKDDDKDNNTLSLRLDINLDIEVELKARIHGDLTLALLQ